MRIILWIAYGAFLLIGIYFIANRETDPETRFLAARPLAFNHLIIESDLQAAFVPPFERRRARLRTPARPAEDAPSADENKVPAAESSKSRPAPAAPPKPPDTQSGSGNQAAQTATPVLPDAKKAKFVGKYTSGTVGQRQLLHDSDFVDLPSLGPPDAGTLRVLLPVNADDIVSGKINAGSLLCVGRPSPVKVVTVICAPGIVVPCNAIVDLKVAEAANLTNDSAGGHNAAVSASTNNKCS
jgi:hypothetical protein